MVVTVDMADTVAVVAVKINDPQAESNRAKTGRKVIITKEEQSC